MHITCIYIYIKPFIWKKNFHIFRISPHPPPPPIWALNSNTRPISSKPSTWWPCHMSVSGVKFEPLTSWEARAAVWLLLWDLKDASDLRPLTTSLPVSQASFENAIAFHLVSARISSMFCFWNFLRESAVSPPGQLPSPACAEQSCRYEVSSEWSPSPLLPSQKLDWLRDLREPWGHSPLRFCSGLNCWKVGEVGK